ncbi:WD repeat-containing protein 46-like [Aphelocoma coerulescens]|uniref:WD repeat-containing protein 46-like n=1 Tax=Aphelocoma coerulescens TaxID=39617 RepID=UPI003604F339
MAQSPPSGLVLLGHANGVVSAWSPSGAEPVLRLLAQRGAVRGLAADASGRFVATSGSDRKLRIFDLRNLGLLQEWGLPAGAAHLEFSQRGLLAAACGDEVQVFGAPLSGSAPRPQLRHRPPAPALALRFCPFQDLLGAGHGAGFSSILVPGAGEPNLDALENNPYRSRRQRQEWEVKALLEKIPAELLTPDPSLLSRLDTSSLEQKRLERLQRLGFDPDSRGKFRPRRRRKGREPERRRRQAAHEELRARIRQSLEQRERERKEKEEEKQEEPPKKRRKKEGKTPQKSGKKTGGKPPKNGEKPPKTGQKTGGKSQRNQEKTGEKAPKNGGKSPKNGEKTEEKSQKTGGKMEEKFPKNFGKMEEKSPKNQGKSQKIGGKIGKNTPQNWENPGGKAPKTQEKPPKFGQNPLKNGGKLPKIGKNPRETPKKKGKGKKGGPGPKLGGPGPKLGGPGPKSGGSLPSKGALERFKK